jgi:peroxiredoxin
MPRVQLNQPAPDFEMSDFGGNKVRLSSFKNENNVVLIFNRGFM